MTPVTAAKVKYGVWGLICGAIIAMIIVAVSGVAHIGLKLEKPPWSAS